MKKEQTRLTVHSRVSKSSALKKSAGKNLNLGAVTEDYPLEVSKACQLLNEALATEILCVLRYRHHQIVAKGLNSIAVAAEFQEHAEQEEAHMMMLAKRISQLGGDPDFSPAAVLKHSLTEFGKSTTLEAMIEEDLIAERVVIIAYREMIEWFAQDSTTRTMLETILKEEEEHADDLAALL